MGQTRDFFSRMGSHLRDGKEVKKIKYFTVDSYFADRIEDNLIISYRPKWE